MRFLNPGWRSLAALAIVPVLAGGVVACSSSDTTTSSTTATQSSSSAVALGETSTVAAAPPQVTVTDPGQEPRQKLSYHPHTTSPVVRDYSVLQGFSQQIVDQAPTGEPQPPAEAVTTTFRLSGEVSNYVAPAKTSEAQAPMGGGGAANLLGVDPQYTTTLTVENPHTTLVDMVEPTASTAGFQFAFDTLDNGKVASYHLTPPKEANNTGLTLIEQQLFAAFAAPVIFPDEEVGVGATWTVRSPLIADDSMLQTITYTVTNIGGTPDNPVVDLDASISRHPALKEISLNQAQPGTVGSLTVLDAQTVSTGSITVDTTQTLPKSGSLAVTTRIAYGPGGAPTPDVPQQIVVQDNHVVVTIASPS